MRASRLISILTILQARGMATAPELARECEVSVRTIYRDIEALSASGVPVYSERGVEGGYRLVAGYRTHLNGFSAEDAAALFLIGLAGPAAALGLGRSLSAARDKILTALPQDLRGIAEEARLRFHLDTPAWFAEAEEPASLAQVARAVWTGRRIRIRYRSWSAEKERALGPLGLVLKGGLWYLVACIDGTARTYRVARVLEVELLEEAFERPAGFDLAAYWKKGTERLESYLYRHTATVRLSPQGVKLFDVLASGHVRQATRFEANLDETGWQTVRIPFGSVDEASGDLLRLGPHAEVIDPPELRQNVVAALAAMHGIYRAR